MDQVSRSSLMWGLIGGIPAYLIIMTSGLYMSEDWNFRIVHTIVLFIALALFSISSVKLYSKLRKLLPLLAALVVHFGIYSFELRELSFTPRLFYMALVYGIFALFGGVFIPMYYRKIKKSRLKEEGIDAKATIEKMTDMGARLVESGVHKSYKVKLELKIMGHPKSPYKVTDIFWVSEYYIHRLTSKRPIPVKVSKKNHKKVALNLPRSE